MTSNIIPLPDRLEPKSKHRALTTSVREYFYPLYNGNEKFRSLLESVDNETSVTKNRFFDRKEAVDMIVAVAKRAENTVVTEAKAGEVYKCLVSVMNGHEELKLKLRRNEYRRLSQQGEPQPAQQAAD